MLVFQHFSWWSTSPSGPWLAISQISGRPALGAESAFGTEGAKGAKRDVLSW